MMRVSRVVPLAGVLVILILLLSACAAATPTATPRPTLTPTPTLDRTANPPPKASEIARHSFGRPDAPVVVVDVFDFR